MKHPSTDDVHCRYTLVSDTVAAPWMHDSARSSGPIPVKAVTAAALQYRPVPTVARVAGGPPSSHPSARPLQQQQQQAYHRRRSLGGSDSEADNDTHASPEFPLDLAARDRYHAINSSLATVDFDDIGTGTGHGDASAGMSTGEREELLRQRNSHLSVEEPDGDEQLYERLHPTAVAKRARLVQGCILILCVVVIWVAASVLVQYIYDDLGFNSPFFLTYVANSLFVSLLPVAFVRTWLVNNYPHQTQCLREKHEYPGRFTWRQTARAGLLVCPVWFAAQCTYNASLSGTTVSSSTILSSTSSLFTLAFSIFFLKEKFHWAKLVGVALCIAGAVMVSVSDSHSKDGGADTVWGDLLSVLSAVFYGAYTTMIRYFIPNEHVADMTTFFGFLGLCNSIILLPIVLLLHFLHVESLGSLTFSIFCWLVFKGLADNVLSDYLWARAVLLTSPTIATVGLSLTIPLAMLSDLVFKAIIPRVLLVFGSIAVIIGFVVVNVAGVPETPAPTVHQRLATDSDVAEPL